ncbi:MAG: branched-chain amino acid ABC transporter permease [Candidatus Bathyarchaeota archaeon]|nr:branched-chain amino acid ABC transporter permease [Candidatus Bathyarchaeota archaeon]
MIEAILISGAISASIYCLLALGLTLIYGVSGVVNLAHGAFFMLGAYFYYVFSVSLLQLHPILALIVSVVCVGIVGAVSYRLFMHPVIRDPVSILVVTVCLALAIQQVVLIAFQRLFLVPIPPIFEGATTIWGVTVTYSKLLAFGASLVVFFSLWMFISKTKIGRTMRALSQDIEVSMLMGVNTTRLYTLTMFLSTALGGAAGIFVGSATMKVAHPYMWFHPLALSFAIVILSGLGSIKGTLVGSIIVAYAEISTKYLAPRGGNVITAVPMVVIAAVLIFRPKGLFGKRVELEE